ncbi:MAG TPA: zinc ribbon domain-containing protein [Pseudonocardiaceae bacterium]|nr:zinc ribbon domain-containing protein [Pseudonocardiaceae bacterium]
MQPDDLICGMCGEGNPPTRRFCSRCGESLQTATVVPTPWWRKVLRFFRQRRLHPAGARPKRRPRLLTLPGMMALVRRTLLVAALLAGLLYAISPSMRGVVHGLVGSLRDRVESVFAQKPVQVHATKTEATAQRPDHPGPMATDGLTNTFWVAPRAADKPMLVVTFDRPTRLVEAIVHNGAAGEQFQALARPAKLHVVFSDGETPIGVADVPLEDKPGVQTVQFGGGDGATRVEIRVVDFYRSEQNPGLALSEIEFFQRPS